MTAHIMVPALDDSGDPATLSHPILTGILREELGYDGVVVTDSLGMEGVRQKYGDDRVPVLALKAGVDQLLNPPSLDVAWHAVLKAVHPSPLSAGKFFGSKPFSQANAALRELGEDEIDWQIPDV